MTREEAVEELYRIVENQYRSAEKDKEALDMAIQALEKEPCEDCISRQDVLAIAGDSCLDLDSYDDTREFCDEIKELPSVTPQLQKLCEDCISRQAVKELFQEACEMKMYDFLGIDDLPSVTPQPKTLNEIRKSHGLPEITARMTIKEAIEFFEEQQEIFGDTECLMHGALSMAQEIFEKIENCDESSATKCFNCINEIKENYREEQKNV